MKWCVLYEDSIRFSDQDGPPDGAPPYGVLGVWQDEPFRPQYNQDVYIYRTDYGWLGVDYIGAIDHALHAIDRITAVKLGRRIPWRQYQTVLQVIKELRP